MANIIVEIWAEIARVRKLLPRLDPAPRDAANRAIAEAERSLAMNEFSSMREAIEDLKVFTIADPPAAAPAPGGEK